MTETKAVQQKPETIREKLHLMIPEFRETLPKLISPERFVGTILMALNKNSDLRHCKPASIMGAVYTMAQIGLEPVGTQAYLVPFGSECTLVIGYGGMVNLFYRSPEAARLSWGFHCKGDEVFEFEYGTHQFLRHKPSYPQDYKNPLSYWVMAKLKTGEENFLVWSKEQCHDHGKRYSKLYNSKYSPWQTAPDIMCLKTVLKQLAKTLPVSYDFQRSLSADESIRHYKPGTKDFEDMPIIGEESVIDLPDLSQYKKAAKETEEKEMPPNPDELGKLQILCCKAWGKENVSAKLKELLPGTGIEEIAMISNWYDYREIETAVTS